MKNAYVIVYTKHTNDDDCRAGARFVLKNAITHYRDIAMTTRDLLMLRFTNVHRRDDNYVIVNVECDDVVILNRVIAYNERDELNDELCRLKISMRTLIDELKTRA